MSALTSLQCTNETVSLEKLADYIEKGQGHPSGFVLFKGRFKELTKPINERGNLPIRGKKLTDKQVVTKKIDWYGTLC